MSIAGTIMDDLHNATAEVPAPPVLLASRSPRRRSLLTQAGVPHIAEHPGFEDGMLEPGRVSPPGWVASLAYLKAWTKLRELREQSRPGGIPEWVLGADTACVVDGELVGTPADAAEAERIIRRFVGREHEVITGVALIHAATDRREVFVDRASVRFGALTDAQISQYAASDLWEGKAGAYNLAERLDAGWPITYEGDPATIMGLPMRALKRRFGTLFAGAA